MDNADLVRCDIQKGLKARHPLIEKLPAMHQNQGVPVPRRDYVRRDDGLAESRCRREHPGIVHQKLRGGVLLFSRQLTQKACTNRLSRLAFIALIGGNAQAIEKTQQSSRHPLGSATCFGNSSAHEMIRGLPNVGRRIDCAA